MKKEKEKDSVTSEPLKGKRGRKTITKYISSSIRKKYENPMITLKDNDKYILHIEELNKEKENSNDISYNAVTDEYALQNKNTIEIDSMIDNIIEKNKLL